jgi:hypothetical protein
MQKCLMRAASPIESDRYDPAGSQLLVHLSFSGDPVIKLPTWRKATTFGAEVGRFPD